MKELIIFIAIILVVAGFLIVFFISRKKSKQDSAEKGLFKKYKRQYEGQSILLVSSIKPFKQPIHMPESLKVVSDVATIAVAVSDVVEGTTTNPNETPMLMKSLHSNDTSTPQKKVIPSNAYTFKSMPMVMIKPGLLVSVAGTQAMILAIFHNSSSNGFGNASPGQIVDVVMQVPGIDSATLTSQFASQPILPLAITSSQA